MSSCLVPGAYSMFRKYLSSYESGLKNASSDTIYLDVISILSFE